MRAVHTRRGLILCSIAVLWWGLAALLGAADPTASWIVDPADNICGLTDPRTLHRPAVVRYEHLVGATPEGEEIERERIDPCSPRGILLRQAAADRIRRASEIVRVHFAYCSVWKAIRHSDRRAVDDLTDAVERLLRRPAISATAPARS